MLDFENTRGLETSIMGYGSVSNSGGGHSGSGCHSGTAGAKGARLNDAQNNAQNNAYNSVHSSVHGGSQTSFPSGGLHNTHTALAHWLTLSLDHVGRGMLLVGPGGQLLHANRLARAALAGGTQALHMTEQGRLCARHARDDKLLADAIDAALNKGLRRMLTLGRSAPAGVGAAGKSTGGSGPACPPACTSTSTPITVAVLPIDALDGSSSNAVLISLPQTSRSKDLAVQIFAREHGCTSAESAVLEALLAGHTPEAIAQNKQVQLCTVRTQIGQLRLKTASHTIRELLDRVAALPPMMVVVQ